MMKPSVKKTEHIFMFLPSILHVETGKDQISLNQCILHPLKCLGWCNYFPVWLKYGHEESTGFDSCPSAASVLVKQVTLPLSDTLLIKGFTNSSSPPAYLIIPVMGGFTPDSLSRWAALISLLTSVIVHRNNYSTYHLRFIYWGI